MVAAELEVEFCEVVEFLNCSVGFSACFIVFGGMERLAGWGRCFIVAMSLEITFVLDTLGDLRAFALS
jgi:hypothetical protein